MSSSHDDAAPVAEMVRAFDFPRYAAALFAPNDKRRAMLALAAFDLEITRIPDQVSQPLPGEVRMQWWSDALEGTEHGGVTGHPVAAELFDALARFNLAREPLRTLIDARKFDLYADPMPTRAALEVYCDDTYGTLVGLNAALLGGDMPIEIVRSAGRALGLSRLLVRLPHDSAHGRCFLPQDDMATHRVTRHQVLAGEESAGLRAVRAALIDAAREHARRAGSAFRTLPRAIRPALLELATIARELDALQNVEPFALAPVPSHLRVLIAQAWAMR